MNSILETLKSTEDLLRSSDILGGQANRAGLLRERLESGELTVSVIGQFKRGKSSLINALIGEELLPAGIVPITSAVTEIRRGDKSAAVSFTNGMVKNVSFEELPDFVNEQKNPGNVQGVSQILLTLPSDFLEGGITLVDTPGVGSVHKNNSVTAYEFVKESDAVVFMLSVDSPINEIEIDFLRNTKEYAGKFYFAVNKIDTISESELAQYLSYCRVLLAAIMDVDDVVLFPLSAKTGKGVGEFSSALRSDLKLKLREILEESARLKLIDIIGCSLSQIELYWKVLLMPPAVLSDTLRSLDAALAELKENASNTVRFIGADKDEVVRGMDNVLKARLNEFKLTLSETVTKIFGMDYHYEITELFEGEKESEKTAKALGEAFLADTALLCDELSATLNKVLMYRNDSTVEVVTRVYELNTLTRTLKRTANALRSEG